MHESFRFDKNQSMFFFSTLELHRWRRLETSSVLYIRIYGCDPRWAALVDQLVLKLSVYQAFAVSPPCHVRWWSYLCFHQPSKDGTVTQDKTVFRTPATCFLHMRCNVRQLIWLVIYAKIPNSIFFIFFYSSLLPRAEEPQPSIFDGRSCGKSIEN